MKQVLQNLKNGETKVADVPCPKIRQGTVLISTQKSIVSAGTERMLVEFGKANFIHKARQQPEKVKQVLSKIKTDGLLATLDAVRSKLDQPLPLGYCNAGIVLESSAEEFKKGDRIVSNGHHAQVVRVPRNLCAKIPDNVDDESAAFTVLASIGLQGIRLINPTLGETIVVSGLGLIGLLTVQMLKANGCRVLGIDFDTERCELARQFGAETVDLSKGEDPIAAASNFSKCEGVDGVIIAAATQSDEVIQQAAQMCRKRGRVVLVGVVGLNLRRDDFFKKEITFQVSCSYGPGRYDESYEEQGIDYPYGYVRWTEQRNFQAVLEMMSAGKINTKPLITSRFCIHEAEKAYQELDNKAALGIILDYPKTEEKSLKRGTIPLGMKSDFQPEYPVVGVIGAGNYASRTLIPAFKAGGAQLKTIATSTGISGVHHGEKAGFIVASTDLNDIFQDQEINTVVIATRHNVHAAQVIRALEAGKNVFVEKPLALTLKELNEIDQAVLKYGDQKKIMVGFNRRFAPLVKEMKSLLEVRKDPKVFIMTVNAGFIPGEHWTQDKAVGGGRIIGEGCHFVDLMRYLAGVPIKGYQAMKLGQTSGKTVSNDKVSINLQFEDGSFGTIHYLANGGKAFPKERIEVFCGNAVLQLNNYRNLTGYGWPGFYKKRMFFQDKGQKTCVKEFLQCIKSGDSGPIPYHEIQEVSRICIEIDSSLQ